MLETLGGAVALAAIMLASTAAAPAHANVVVDCATGPVTVAESNEVIDVVGTCSTVTVTASNNEVDTDAVSTAGLVGSNNTLVVAGRLARTTVKGANNVVKVHRRR